MKIRIDFKSLLKQLEEELLKQVMDELKKKVRKAAGMTNLSSTAKREYVMMELVSAGLIDGFPRHLINLAIEAVVAAEKAGEVA